MHKLLMIINHVHKHDVCCCLCEKYGRGCPAGCSTAKEHRLRGGPLVLECVQGDNGRACICSHGFVMKSFGKIAGEMGITEEALRQKLVLDAL